MIFVGYQGIGKSTLGGKNRYIDLESGNFWVDGKRSDDWYFIYCNLAEHLSRQGYFVFTSSHEVVRNQLQRVNQRKFIISPTVGLKGEWITRLSDRYDNTKSIKDYKAWKNAEDRYADNVLELQSDRNFEQIIISEIPYDLDALILNAVYNR